MSTRLTFYIVIGIVVLSLLAGAVVWNQLPEQMASHWDINDQVDGSMPRTWVVFYMLLFSLGLFLLFMVFPLIDPLKANIARFRPLYNLFALMLVFFLVYLWKLTILWNLGFTQFRMSMAILPALGLVFMFIAFVLRRSKRNWFIGIRTPWTLSSDRVWEQTHRIGSILFFFSGILALIGSLADGYAVWFVFVPIIGSSLFLVVYSYVAYRREIS